jgi:hypothetical protein
MAVGGYFDANFIAALAVFTSAAKRPCEISASAPPPTLSGKWYA